MVYSDAQIHRQLPIALQKQAFAECCLSPKYETGTDARHRERPDSRESRGYKEPGKSPRVR
jgi:hypothetical protein